MKSGMHGYSIFKRKPGKNRTILTKQFQSSKSITFLVRDSIAHKFPKRGISFLAIHMADLILADGVVYKNVFGPI